MTEKREKRPRDREAEKALAGMAGFHLRSFAAFAAEDGLADAPRPPRTFLSLAARGVC